MEASNGLMRGHEGRVPQTNSEIRETLTQGLVSLDANVLLSFYRFSPNARQGLLQVLQALGDRVFVSHQAAREFWRNRLSAIDARTTASDQLSGALEKAEKQVQDAIRVWAKQTAADRSTELRLVSAYSSAVKECLSIADDETSESATFAYDIEKDSVVVDLASLLRDRVGHPLSEEAQSEALKEARRRSDAGLPPGFRDAAKDDANSIDGSAGDYLVWLQSMEEAADRELPLVLVTGDEKEDWWWKHRGQFLGPRAELVDEFAQRSSLKFVMLRPAQLIEHADVLKVSVAADVQSDVARGSEAEPSLWTKRAVDLLLSRLDDAGREQADVIRRAAALGGTISREEVYEVCGYAPDRMLRGFTRPTNRITADLQLEGVLDDAVAPMLAPVYETGVTALRFEIPQEVVAVLAREDEADVADG